MRNMKEAITYTITVKTEFDSDATRQAMKSTACGGHDLINPAEYLNIWIAKLAGNTSGYAVITHSCKQQ